VVDFLTQVHQQVLIDLIRVSRAKLTVLKSQEEQLTPLQLLQHEGNDVIEAFRLDLHVVTQLQGVKLVELARRKLPLKLLYESLLVVPDQQVVPFDDQGLRLRFAVLLLERFVFLFTQHLIIDILNHRVLSL